MLSHLNYATQKRKLFCGAKSVVRELKTPEIMLKDRLKQDSVTALKNHDSHKVEVLRYLISLIDKKDLQLPPGTMTEVDMISVLQKELKNKEESREMFAKAGRADLVDGLDYEIVLVKEYLPQSINEDELGQIVSSVIDEVGINFGMVMKNVVSKVAGRVGGDVISKIVKQKISERV